MKFSGTRFQVDGDALVVPISSPMSSCLDFQAPVDSSHLHPTRPSPGIYPFTIFVRIFSMTLGG